MIRQSYYGKNDHTKIRQGYCKDKIIKQINQSYCKINKTNDQTNDQSYANDQTNVLK